MTPHQIALLTNERAIGRLFFEYRQVADRVMDGTEFYSSLGRFLAPHNSGERDPVSDAGLAREKPTTIVIEM